jgi:glycosyltransferase involved in cell wall biosynthesis
LSVAPRRRVLLISPVPDLDPPSGDVVYTEALLRHPPPGVEYETYSEAIAAGRLKELGRRQEFRDASGLLKLGALIRITRERGINALRTHSVLFREPFRFFSVQSGAYDLVHCHVFSTAFKRLDAPLVVSNASFIEELYRGARGWSARHIRWASKADAAIARGLRVQHTSHAMPAAAAVVCSTETLRAEMLRRGCAEADRLHVAPVFVERPSRRIPGRRRPTRIGFVATDFEAKGGRTVLDAFKIVRRREPDAQLLVIGSPPRTDRSQLATSGIVWLPRVGRSELLQRHLPSLDVFAYPTECDGLPLIVLEAMALGVPVATSDYFAMPEIVGHGTAGSVTPQRDAPALADALLWLLEPQNNAEVRSRAAEWFDTHFAPEAAVAQLGRAYDAAAAAN